MSNYKKKRRRDLKTTIPSGQVVASRRSSVRPFSVCSLIQPRTFHTLIQPKVPRCLSLQCLLRDCTPRYDCSAQNNVAYAVAKGVWGCGKSLGGARRFKERWCLVSVEVLGRHARSHAPLRRGCAYHRTLVGVKLSAVQGVVGTIKKGLLGMIMDQRLLVRSASSVSCEPYAYFR